MFSVANFEWLWSFFKKWFLSSHLENATRSTMKSEMMKCNENKSVAPTRTIAFQSISRHELLFKILKFYSSVNHGDIFSGYFCKGILNFWFEPRDEITGHEIIIAFIEDSIGLKHRHRWRDDIFFRSCNLFKSQYLQLRMG